MPRTVRITARPLKSRTKMAGLCALLRILEKFLQLFDDFHLSPVFIPAEAVHLIAVVLIRR